MENTRIRQPSGFCRANWLMIAFVGCLPWGPDAVGQSSSLQANPERSFPCSVTAPNLKKYTEAELAPLHGQRGWMTTTAPDGTRTTVESSLGNHGNDALSTVLWPEGKVVFKPSGSGFVLENGALSMKFPWWRLVKGRLTIEGRRLDGPAPPLRARVPDGYGEIGFQATALIFPTPGCWEVTGRVAGQSLTFVTLVEKIGNGPGR
jgi:hypothetical protein